ncbi:hypothetical protein GCM10010464_41340 [Pseudonocardia yunnanensis]
MLVSPKSCWICGAAALRFALSTYTIAVPTKSSATIIQRTFPDGLRVVPAAVVPLELVDMVLAPLLVLRPAC